MKKKLPYLVFYGTEQRLIEIEPILVMIGYKNDKQWNTHTFTNPRHTIKTVSTNEGIYAFFTLHKNCWVFDNAEARFKAKDINKAIDYLIKEGYLK